MCKSLLSLPEPRRLWHWSAGYPRNPWINAPLCARSPSVGVIAHGARLATWRWRGGGMPSSADSTTSQHRRKSTEASNLPPPLLVPPDANHNLIALKQSCISRTRAQPRGRSRPYPRRVGLPEQDGTGSVTFPATYKSPERTRQGVSGDDEPWSLPAGRSAQSWWQWTVPRMRQLRLKGTLPARAISWFPSARRKSGTALDACGVRRL